MTWQGSGGQTPPGGPDDDATRPDWDPVATGDHAVRRPAGRRVAACARPTPASAAGRDDAGHATADDPTARPGLGSTGRPPRRPVGPGDLRPTPGMASRRWASATRARCPGSWRTGWTGSSSASSPGCSAGSSAPRPATPRRPRWSAPSSGSGSRCSTSWRSGPRAVARRRGCGSSTSRSGPPRTDGPCPWARPRSAGSPWDPGSRRWRCSRASAVCWACSAWSGRWSLLVTTVTSPTKQGLHDRFAGSAIVQPIGREGPVIPCLILLVLLFVVLPLIAVVGLLAVGSAAHRDPVRGRHLHLSPGRR